MAEDHSGITDDPRFTSQDIIRARLALDSFHSAVGDYVNAKGILPAPGSPALTEEVSFPDRGSVQTVYAQAIMLLEVAGDQLTAFLKTIDEPSETIAPWLCVRGLLEACALLVWLLDPGLDIRDRVGRSKAFRYEGLLQQRKYVVSAGADPKPVERRLGQLVRDAKALGYDSLVDRRGKSYGIGRRMPSMTDLMASGFKKEDMYRLLSAMAHGHHWAIHLLSFELTPECETPADAQPGYRAMTKAVNPTGVMYLAKGSAEAFGLATWYQAGYCGWDREGLAKTLKALFDSLGLADNRRFWMAAPAR